MQKQSDTQAIISNTAYQALLHDVSTRRLIEACGVLLGHIDENGSWHITQVHPLPNIFNSSVYFEFAPEDLLTVELNYPGQIVGVYHSHPTGLAVASKTDQDNMKRVNIDEHIPWVWLIISGPFHETTPLQAREKEPGMIAYHHYELEGLQTIPIHVIHDTEANWSVI